MGAEGGEEVLPQSRWEGRRAGSGTVTMTSERKRDKSEKYFCSRRIGMDDSNVEAGRGVRLTQCCPIQTHEPQEPPAWGQLITPPCSARFLSFSLNTWVFGDVFFWTEIWRGFQNQVLRSALTAYTLRVQFLEYLSQYCVASGYLSCRNLRRPESSWAGNSDGPPDPHGRK